MGRFTSFVLGLIVGGGLVYGSEHYHVLRSNDGLHLIPKLTATFSDTYVDIRDFDAGDWAEHETLAAAILRADKEHLFKEAVVGRVHDAVDGLLDELSRMGKKVSPDRDDD